jgi:hypothetical protein
MYVVEQISHSRKSSNVSNKMKTADQNFEAKYDILSTGTGFETLLLSYMHSINLKRKGKAIPVTGRGDP